MPLQWVDASQPASWLVKGKDTPAAHHWLAEDEHERRGSRQHSLAHQQLVRFFLAAEEDDPDATGPLRDQHAFLPTNLN
jgi:hypothetical protein